MSVEVHSLGCRLNLAESEEMRAMLAGEENLVIVNSCAVTTEAVRQTRQTIRRARRQNPDSRLIVTGCAAEVERERLSAMPEVDGLVSNTAKLDPRAWNAPASAGLRTPAPAYTRGFVQVQNGCDHACTFCVIPQGRGPSRSRPVQSVLNDIAIHADAGVNEIVLTGVDLTSWGSDLAANTHAPSSSASLGMLCEAILTHFPALPRLRLSSVDGAEVDARLFDLLASEARVMPHVHLSLQHGNDLILKRMKRRHTRAQALDLVTRLRAARPELAVGADLIAGFPTEDDAAHADNLSIIDALDIVHGHIFPYSTRPGTPAARMPQITPETIRSRARELRAAVAARRESWLARQVGKTLTVLSERGGHGHAENFAPVRLPVGPDAIMPGTLIRVTPNQVFEGILE